MADNCSCSFNPNGLSGNMYFRGDWEFCPEYKVGDVVQFNGTLYLAMKPSAGKDPQMNKEYWRIFDMKPPAPPSERNIIDGGYATELSSKRYSEIRIRRDKELNWEASNPRLGIGELGVDLTNLRIKAGNGIDHWKELPYINDDLYTQLDDELKIVNDKIAEILQDISLQKIEIDTRFDVLDAKISNARTELLREVNSVKTSLNNEISDLKSLTNARFENIETSFETEISDLREQTSERISAIEIGNALYQADLTEKFEEVKSDTSRKYNDFTQNAQSLSTRLDTVIGSVTEDMEILDARVDGDGVAHNNLGQAIRHIHKQTHEELNTLDFELQQQIQSNAAANIENTLGLVKEIQDRKASIAQTENALREALQEAVGDEHAAESALSERIDSNAEAIHTEQEAREGAVAQLEARTNSIQLAVEDEDETNRSLNAQINKNARGVVENTLLIINEAKQLNERISNVIANEAEQRQQADNQEQEARIADTADIRTDIAQIGVDDKTDKSALEEQINANATANLENTLNLTSEAEQRRQGDNLERARRIEDTTDIRTKVALLDITNETSKQVIEEQINDNARATLENVLSIAQEAEQRRKDISQEHANRVEDTAQIREEFGQELESEHTTNQVLQEQINANATANLENAANLAREAQRRRIEIADERMTRISDDELLKAEIKRTVNYEYINNRDLQEQTNDNSEGIFEVLLNIAREAQERRELENELIQHGENIQNQLNLLWEAIAENVLTVEQASKMRQAIDALERSQRIKEDEGLQLQINSLAEAVHELLLQQGRTGKTIKTLDGKVDALEIAASETGTNFASDEDFAGYMSDILGP